jgi:putative acetyltransferase
MGVLPDRQRRGAGSALVREGLRRAAETDFPLVVVVGHADFYPRFGFRPAAQRGVTAPFEVAPSSWMVHLLPAYRSTMRGRVIYAEPFEGLG